MDRLEQKLDLKKVRAAFNRAADTYDQAAVLQREVCRRLLEKLEPVRLSPERIMDAGTGTGNAVKPLSKLYKKADLVLFDLSECMLRKAQSRGRLFKKPRAICSDLESIPISDNSFDLVFSNLTLQWCNDLLKTLSELKRVIRAGGLLQFSTFGPDTLKELRESWAKVDDRAHVNSFLDMHDIGDTLMQLGFAEPVMASEIITVEYGTADELLKDLRDIGANVTAKGMNEGLVTPRRLEVFRTAYESFRRGGSLPASYEVIYGHAWVPEENPSVGVIPTRMS